MKPRGPILILGATSGIGKALARHMAARKIPLVLAGRDRAHVETLARDAAIRHGVFNTALCYEALDFKGHEAFLDRCFSAAGAPLAGVVLCQGVLIDQDEAERRFELARRMIEVNFTSAVSLLGAAAERLARQGGGFLCALSSVAGDRGRQSNYLYGATKAALNLHLQGLRNAYSRRNLAVITVKPGPVDTAMTWGLVRSSSPLLASPDRIARDVLRAIERRSPTAYSPWFWRPIMFLIRHIPEPLFNRMRI